MARLSVIVPTFNRVGYLGETIASVLTQDYRDFELVVADNASTDGTAALLDGVTDPRLRHVRRAHNIGWRANFNQALDGADSEFVALVSDDDRLLPGALARAVRFMDEVHTAGFVHTTYHVIDDRGDVLRTDGNRSGGVVEDRVQPGSDFIVSSMRAVSRVCLSSAVVEDGRAPGGVLRGGRPGARRLRVVPPRRARLGRRVPGNPRGRAPDPPRATLERARQQLHRRGALRCEAPIPLGQRGTRGARGCAPTCCTRLHRIGDERACVDRGARVPRLGVPSPSPRHSSAAATRPGSTDLAHQRQSRRRAQGPALAPGSAIEA